MIEQSSTPQNRNFSRHKKNAAGFTLIEMLAVTSLGAVLTGITITTLAAFLRFDNTVNLHAERRIELQQLSAKIRNDIHQATAFQWDVEQNAFVLETPNKKNIRYHLMEDRWIRSAEQDDNTTRTTAYALDDSFLCECEPTQAQPGDRIRIRFYTELDSLRNPNKPANDCETIATLGRDSNLLSE